MPAKYERLLGPRRRDNDVGTIERFIEIASHDHIETSADWIGNKPAGCISHRIKDAD